MGSSFGAKFARRFMVLWGIFSAVTGFLCRELCRHEFMLEVATTILQLPTSVPLGGI